ncbi:MAG: prepilin-type N-terminal cleavage/methylation domain-containing protein [Desulfobacterales bacterium]|nr:prepilin-type N-terminal cleavage/methylation domain-containing protein [Desulfobacterales bacterium]
MFNKIRKSIILNRIVSQKNNHRGFTLVEMVMVLAISTIVLAAMYSVFTIANKNFTTQNAAANVQQNLRSAIGLMARDIRVAGLDPTGSDNFGITYASQTKIRFTLDSIDSGSGDFNGIVDEANFEEITYGFQGNQVMQTLYETVTSSTADAAALISNIKEVKFKYYDSANNDLGDPVPADQLENIRNVEILVTHEEPAGREGMVSRTLTRRVECRNLAFN